MTTLNLAELVERGELAAVAREAEIPYARLWRAGTGGLIKGLKREELERLNHALSQRRQIVAHVA